MLHVLLFLAADAALCGAVLTDYPVRAQFGSHWRESNPRPTVYETVALAS